MTIEDQEMAVVGDEPAYLKQTELPTDDDNFDSTDVIVPTIKLLQGVSSQITDFPEAKVGDFWHTGLDESIGSSFTFVIAARRKKYLLMAPMEDTRGILARADDAKTWDRLGNWDIQLDKRTTVKWEINDLDVVESGLAAWGSSYPEDPDSPPAATLFYEYLILVADRMDIGPCMFSVARSQIAPTKKGLNTKISLHNSMGRPLQSISYRVGSNVQINSAGQEYKNLVYTGAGFASEALYKRALEVKDKLPFSSITVQGETDILDEDRPAKSIDDEDIPY